MIISLQFCVSGLLLIHVCNRRPDKHPSTAQEVSLRAFRPEMELAHGRFYRHYRAALITISIQLRSRAREGKYEVHRWWYVDFSSVLDDDWWLLINAGWLMINLHRLTSSVGNILRTGLLSALWVWRCLTQRLSRTLPAAEGSCTRNKRMLSGQHYNQCDKATNKDQAREREEREREK